MDPSNISREEIDILVGCSYKMQIHWCGDLSIKLLILLDGILTPSFGVKGMRQDETKPITWEKIFIENIVYFKIN